ncbi:MAG: beta-ketoacyl-[acyl-carrier-protein] synthase family protein [Solirubrobacterales bacterium]
MADVVVTGIGAISPGGLGAEALWEAALRGQSLPEGDVAVGPDPSDQLTIKESRRLDKFARFGLVAAREAVADAGLDFEQLDRERCGAVVGTGIGGFETIDDGMEILREKGPRMVPATSVPMLMPNAAIAAVTKDFGIWGPGHCVVSACASGNHALGEAKRMIEYGHADLVVAGSAETANRPLATSAFRAMGAMTSKGVSRPFDAERDGFVMGEGAGMLILESAEHAAARGARVYCRLAGYGATNDAYHLVQPDPEGRGARSAMTKAIAEAGLEPKDIDYINAHGTSTPYNDLSETKAVKQVWGDNTPPPMSSTKSLVGHMMGASGSVEAVVCVMSIRDNKAHQTVNLNTPDPECDLDYIAEGSRELEINKVLSNSFGFGGHNACLVFEAV